MKSTFQHLRSAISVAVLALGASSGLVQAQVNVHIDISPPAPRYEVVPAVRPGYIWAPGYWAWQGGRYDWVNGRPIPQRVGQRWVPDHWEPGNRYRAGYWAPDRGYENGRGYNDDQDRGEHHGKKHGGKHGDKHGDKHGEDFCPPGQAKKGNC